MPHPQPAPADTGTSETMRTADEAVAESLRPIVTTKAEIGAAYAAWIARDRSPRGPDIRRADWPGLTCEAKATMCTRLMLYLLGQEAGTQERSSSSSPSTIITTPAALYSAYLAWETSGGAPIDGNQAADAAELSIEEDARIYADELLKLLRAPAADGQGAVVQS